MPKIRPRVTTSCVADRYANKGERIVEFAFPGDDGAGGLISLRRHVYTNAPIVEVYRAEGITVLAPVAPPERGTLAALRELANAAEQALATLDAIRTIPGLESAEYQLVDFADRVEELRRTTVGANDALGRGNAPSLAAAND